MQKRRFGLRTKFVLIIVSFTTLLFVGFSFLLVSVNIRTLSQNLNQETKSFAELATQPIGEAYINYNDTGRIRIAQAIQTFRDLNDNITNISVVDKSASVLYIDSPEIGVEVDKATASSFVPVFETNENGNTSLVTVPFFEKTGIHRYSIIYTVSDQSIQDSINRQIYFIVLFVSIGLLVSVIAMYELIEHNFIGPIKRLSLQALAISAGNIDNQINIDRRDEVADLATAVNQMADSLKDDIYKLEELDKIKTEFLIIASHNLRTPLTIIRGYLEQADLATDIDEVHKMLKMIKEGSERLNNLTEDMITIAEVESGKKVGKRDEVNLREFLNTIAEEFKEQALEKNVEFIREIDNHNCRLHISKSLVNGAIWSLLENAIKFTKEGGKITISSSVIDDKAFIQVKDTGIGISEEEQAKLFTKFHRGTSTLTYDYEGVGIGLYSAKLIVEQHGGDISVESTLGLGSIFTISLPVAEPEILSNSNTT